MSESAQERTEEATSKRQEDMKKKGQAPRSRDLNTTIVLLAGSGGLLVFGANLVESLGMVMQQQFTLSRADIFNPSHIVLHIANSANFVITKLLPIYTLMVGAALMGPAIIGGFVFSFEAMQPKGERLDPLKGIQRMFSVKSLVELIKALGKFVLIATIAILFVLSQYEALLTLNNQPVKQALAEGAQLLGWAFLCISSSLIIIAAIDVPFQVWDHMRKAKMTKQEVRDEMRDSEGKPEVKQHIRHMQQQMAQRRMMAEIPEADVIITNPTHYAIAIKYDRDKNFAPIVVAKGVDLIAEQIRRIALEYKVIFVSAPPLARSLYYNTELNDEVPTELYVAVAQVLAYVYQLREYRAGRSATPKDLPEIDIPEGFKR